jgi:hypothetical protein
MNLRRATNLEVTEWTIKMVISLQIPTIFWMGKRNYVSQMKIHTAELLVPDPSPLEVEIVIVNLKFYNRQELLKSLQNWFKQD